jgi:chromosome segregation ATPase
LVLGSGSIVTGQDQELVTEVKKLTDSLKSLSADLRSKEDELQTANLLLEYYKEPESSATEAINNLEAKIRQLQAANKELEEDLDIAQEVNNKQAQLAANKSARMMFSTPTRGVKREMEEDNDDNGPGRARNFARG